MSRITLQGEVANESLRVWECNRGDWQACEEDGEAVLSLPDNQTLDWREGTVAISGDAAWRDYEYSFELCLLAGAGEPMMAWPGAVVRAQDCDNYEVFWFMPQFESDGGDNVVYLSVAHSMVPWWSDAYVNNPRGRAPYTPGEWLPISVRVEGLDASVRVRNRPEPILTVRLTYYLDGGRIGVYCGSQTSASFRRMKVDLLPPQPIPDPPSLALSR